MAGAGHRVTDQRPNCRLRPRSRFVRRFGHGVSNRRSSVRTVSVGAVVRRFSHRVTEIGVTVATDHDLHRPDDRRRDPTAHARPPSRPGHPVRARRRPEVVLVRLFPHPRLRLLERRQSPPPIGDGAVPSRTATARAARPASSPTTATRRSAGSASDRARTTSGSPTRRSSSRSTTSRSGRSSASSSVAGLAGRGVARSLLGAGIDYARDHGATMLEAYPVDVPGGQRIPSGSVYRGTLRCSSGPGSRSSPGVHRPARSSLDPSSGGRSARAGRPLVRPHGVGIDRAYVIRRRPPRTFVHLDSVVPGP